MPTTHRKRNLAILAVLTLFIVVASAAVINEFTSPTYIYYSIAHSDDSVKRYYLDDVNAITIEAQNLGRRDGTFGLVLGMVNVTFSNKTALPYYAEATIARFPFFLPGNNKTISNRTVFFTINQNVTGVYFSLRLEKYELNPYFTTFPTSYETYLWNETGQYYELRYGGGGVP